MTTYLLTFWVVATTTHWGFSAEVLQYRTVELKTYQDCLNMVENVKPKTWRCTKRERA